MPASTSCFDARVDAHGDPVKDSLTFPRIGPSLGSTATFTFQGEEQLKFSFPFSHFHYTSLRRRFGQIPYPHNAVPTPSPYSTHSFYIPRYPGRPALIDTHTHDPSPCRAPPPLSHTYLEISALTGSNKHLTLLPYHITRVFGRVRALA